MTPGTPRFRGRWQCSAAEPAVFARVGKHPKAVIVALACQRILLPALCFGLVVLFQLPPILAVGMILLAASPGGATANLYSHLFRGDVALNVTLTAINSIVALFRVEPRQAVASAFEIGIHNATLAIVIAQTVIGSVEMSLPAAIYGVLMFFVALVFGFLIRSRIAKEAPAATA